MYLNPITGLTEGQWQENQAIYESLGERGLLNPSKAFATFNRSSSYARHNFSGKLAEGVELTELEIAMICDNGFSWFGGSSTLKPDGTFHVTVYFD